MLDNWTITRTRLKSSSDFYHMLKLFSIRTLHWSDGFFFFFFGFILFLIVFGTFKNCFLLSYFRNLFRKRRNYRLLRIKEKPFWPKSGMSFVFLIYWGLLILLVAVVLWEKRSYSLIACVSVLNFRFLRRRHGYLQKMQYFKTETENFQHQNSDVQPEISAEERNYSNLNEAVKSSQTRVSEIKSILVTTMN